MKSSLIAILGLVACGGTPKEPSAPESKPSTTASAEPAKEAKQADVASAASAPEPEAPCEKDADCTVFADCCSCKAVGAKAPPPTPCDSVCGESKCEVKGKTIDNVACVAGVCKLK